MTTTGELADFALEVEYDVLPDEVVDAVKRRLLDSVAIAVGASGERPVAIVADTVRECNRGGPCRLWGTDDRASPPDAAMYNTALVRYLDYMDSFLAPGETPHPSDNVAAVVACGEYEDRSGEDLIADIAVAYEIQGELAWNAPMRDRGWDHVTHTVISATAASGKALGLGREALRSAIGIAGTAHNALRVTRTEGISMWKGIASANAARNAVYSALLARNGMEGPVDLFEGGKGWKEVISGEFDVALDPGCRRVLDAMTKRYVAETYAQSAIEGIIDLAEGEGIDPSEVASIRLDTFAGAKLIIGGGEGSRYEVETKEQADHSLPYMLAAALVDREMTDAQYRPERIARRDVQDLLQRVEITENPDLTGRFEAGEMPAVVDVTLEDGTTYRVEKSTFRGHPSNPMSWDELEEKFAVQAAERYDERRREEVVATIRSIEDHDVGDLVDLLE